MKTLIIFGTRYGSTASTSQEIAEVLRNEGFDVEVIDAHNKMIDDLTNYELVLIGSGVQMGKWTKEPQKFMKRNNRELQQKKVALFISSGAASIEQAEGNKDEYEKLYHKQVIEVAKKFNIKSIKCGMFGGVWDYNQMGGLARKMLGNLRDRLKNAGFIGENDIYDTRDIESIRTWAKELAQKASH